MQIKAITPKLLIISSFILIAAFSRLVPHPPNFTAVGAIALFGAAHFTNRFLAIIIPVSAMILSDIIIGFHSNIFSVYIAFIAIVFLGFWLQKNFKVKNIFTASLCSSLLFFIITNFSVWLISPIYPNNIIGLLECYIAALPFAMNTISGDLFFNTILFGAYYFLGLKVTSLQNS